MGREVRMVPPGWQHPRYESWDAPFPQALGRYIPMHNESHAEAVKQWHDHDLPAWVEGERLWREERMVRRYDGSYESIGDIVARETAQGRGPGKEASYDWYAGKCPERPSASRYFPDWTAESRTHYMMYETTSEGTPKSPAFSSPEELARWLADTGASMFGSNTASYEDWLAIARGRPSLGLCLSVAPNPEK